jgi:hypothetical protein
MTTIRKVSYICGCGALIVGIIALLTGCAPTRVTFNATKPDGSRTALTYWSAKNIDAELNSNGTWRVKADAATVVDAQTRAIATVAGAVAEGVAKGAK